MQENESPDDYDGIVVSTVHKAKGLEFNNVLVYDDYCFKAIESSVVNQSVHCDEANLLYVAITRSMCNLYLTERVHLCLENLTKHAKASVPSNFSLDSSKKKLADWQQRWERFEVTPIIGSINDIPLPPDWRNDEYPFALHRSMSLADQKRQLWQFLRIYHPDKFLSKYQFSIQPRSVEEEIKKILGEITMKCKEILDVLRSEDIDLYLM